MRCNAIRRTLKKRLPGKMLDQAIEILTAKAAEDGRYIVTLEQHAQASKMYEAVMANPLARIIIEDCEPEVTMLAKDPETGCPVKGRADIWCTGHDLIGDIKTTDSAGYEDYSRACGKFGYHVQAALYPWLARQNGSDRAFRHIVVEKNPPHGVRVVKFDREAIDYGWQRCQTAFRRFAECYLSDSWPGYPDDVMEVSLAKWAL